MTQFRVIETGPNRCTASQRVCDSQMLFVASPGDEFEAAAMPPRPRLVADDSLRSWKPSGMAISFIAKIRNVAESPRHYALLRPLEYECRPLVSCSRRERKPPSKSDKSTWIIYRLSQSQSFTFCEGLPVARQRVDPLAVSAQAQLRNFE